MNPKNPLPVIIVSACDRQTAESFITELIDEDEVSGTEGEHEAVEGRVWRLVNKYYRAAVEVRPRGDSDPLPDDADAVEGHVVYFTPQECRCEATVLVELAEARALAGRGAGVRVLALRCEAAPPALAAWAPRARYERAALMAPPRRGPFAEPPGVARVRAALHAHPWRGLARLDRPPRPAPPDGSLSPSSSSGGSEAEDEDEAEAAAVERAEQFARALAALGEGAAGAAGAGAGAAGDGERLERAEQLVAAFCRALGHDLDAC